MRDVARIDRIIRKLRIAWYTDPDSRLLQLMVNLTANKVEPYGDRFYVEDEELERELDVIIARNA